jgi:hypothetical protein
MSKKHISCHSCKSRKQLCKNPKSEYTHLTDKHLEDVLNMYDGYASSNFSSARDARNVLLSFLHNTNRKKYTRSDVEKLVIFMENSAFTPIDDHLDCFGDQLNHFLILVRSFNETFVDVYENVYSYYKDECWTEFSDRNWYDVRRLYFRKWLESL